MPRVVLHLTLLTCALGSAVAQTLAESVDAILAAPPAREAWWGIHAVDLSSGKVVYSRNANVPFTPASNTKLFTSALALLRLGPDFRFQTRVFASTAPDAAGVVHGDLILAGGGDPTLSARAVPYENGPAKGDPLAPLDRLAAQVANSGVRAIEGDIVGDDTRWPWRPYPEGWAVGDIAWAYGAPVSALAVNENAVTLTVRPAAEAAGASTIEWNPAIEPFTVFNTLHTAAGAKSDVDIERAPGSQVLRISGVAAPGGAPIVENVAVADPALFAAQVFRQLLASRGVSVRGAPRAAHRLPGQLCDAPQGKILASRESPPLIQILGVLDKISHNLYAEMVLREIGYSSRGDGSIAAAEAEMTSFLTSIGAAEKQFALQDGSGLSRNTLITPLVITALLSAMHSGGQREQFRSILPVAGKDGTLEDRFQGQSDAPAIRAKTGTLSHVSALSGYAGEDPAHRIAFSIVVNGYTAPTDELRAVIDRIALALLRSTQP
jgi:serine-type D-Ala-D-Ala carboxypeptidase/endopeptidase (penicillin-binding protein 4)